MSPSPLKVPFLASSALLLFESLRRRRLCELLRLKAAVSCSCPSSRRRTDPPQTCQGWLTPTLNLNLAVIYGRQYPASLVSRHCFIDPSFTPATIRDREYKVVQKNQRAKFSEESSIWADWLCRGCLRQWATGRREIPSIFFVPPMTPYVYG